MTDNISFWEYDSYFANVDIVIVGAGIVGLSTAIELKKKSPLLKVLVLERGAMPSGASTKNAGFACFGSPSELLDDLSRNTEENVVALVAKRWKGLQVLRNNLGDKNIGFEPNGGYEIFLDEVGYEKCSDNLTNINKMLSGIFNGEGVFDNADNQIKLFGFKGVRHLLFNKFEGQVNTGMMMLSLYQKAIGMGVIVLYNMYVDKVIQSGNKAEVILNNFIEVSCTKVLVATNGFAKTLLPELPVQPARSQVLVTSALKNCLFKGSFHYDKGFYYFRNVGNRVLFGGGRNLDLQNEFTDKFALTEKIQHKLEELLKEVILPNEDFLIDYRWSGIMGVGAEKSTIIKKLDSSVFCAVRMGGMGVAIGSLVAQEAAELLINS